MTTLYRLAHAQWFGALLLLGTALALPMLIVNSELFWIVAIASAGLGIAGFTSSNRWMIALPAVFALGLLTFNLRTFDFPGATLAIVLVFTVGTLLTLWLLPMHNENDIVLAYAGGIVLLQVFFILVFWPINFASRSLVFTAAAFVLFELLESRKRDSSITSLMGTIGLSVVAVGVTILTADWQSF